MDVKCSLAAPFSGGRVGPNYVYKISHTDTEQQLPAPSLEMRLHWVSICRMME